MLLRTLIVIVAVAACGDAPMEPAAPDGGPDAIPCTIVGDLAQPPELQVIHQTVDGTAAPLDDGAGIRLVDPPQGGKILLVGVRVTNVDLCEATIQVAMTDLVTDRVAGIERRPVSWRIADDGFAEPAQPDQISDYANVPVCPNANIAQDIDGNPWRLQVRFYDRSQRATERQLTVTPSCETSWDPALCRCECSADPVSQCPAS